MIIFYSYFYLIILEFLLISHFSAFNLSFVIQLSSCNMILDGWVKVDIEEGQGFVSTEFVDLSTEFVKAESKAEEEARKAAEQAALLGASGENTNISGLGYTALPDGSR